MSHAMYPGTFDPFTNGHLDILERSLRLFDRVNIVVAGNGRKNPLFQPAERVEMITEVVSHLKNVSVETYEGLIMDYARSHKIGVVVRGLRAVSDFDHEFSMSTINRELEVSVETIFMMTSAKLFFVSSSMVKEIVGLGGDASPYVPKNVLKQMKLKLDKK